MYLDNAATTQLNSKAKKYIIELLDSYGNPSSQYEIGNKNRQVINKARETVYKFINANENDSDIVFTSSGSASNSLAIQGILNDNYKLYYSPISHKSMLLACEYFNGNKLYITTEGFISIGYLNEQLKSCDKIPVVCFEAANSELGSINNIKEIINLVHKYNGIVICDFTGYIPYYKVDVSKLNVDIATFSCHKLYALKGVGILYKKKNIELKPLIFGSQEYGLFAGTENVIGVASVDIALAEYSYKDIKSENRDYLYKVIIEGIDDCYLIGSIYNRLPHNLYMCFKGVNAISLVALLDTNNYQVSTGSACNNGSTKPSNTLQEIKLNEEDLNSCIRITLSGRETKDELDGFFKVLKESVQLCRSL